MKFRSAFRIAMLSALLGASACSSARDLDQSAAAVDADAGPRAHAGARTSAGNHAPVDAGYDAAPAPFELDKACMKEIADSTDGLPQHLRCTGLYSDFAHKTPASDVHPYTPGLVLWSDGANKKRFIRLPEGTKIDASKPGDWTFPVGTQLFKEFSVGKRRVETRLFQKVRADRWVRATYEWTIEENDALRFGGGDIDLGGGQTYHVPTGSECDKCHEGRHDRILGFEQIGLGVAAADGMTLVELIDQKLISPLPKPDALQIPDDGSGNQAEIIGWMHMNCGVSCHNDNPDSTGYSTKLRLRLNPDELDGRPASELAAYKNTVNVDATTQRWKGQKRIVPGSPDQSLLFMLVGSRAGKNDQMPPLASRVVDQQHLDALRAWITSMPPVAGADGGM